MVDSEEIIVKVDRDLYTDDEWRELVEQGCIIRCKDCKHYQTVRIGYPKFCSKHSHMSEPGDYCSWGERNEDDGELSFCHNCGAKVIVDES